VSRSILDIFVFVLFIKVMNFYVITKAKKLEEEGREFTRKQNLVK
jgi:hypothetical protein